MIAPRGSQLYFLIDPAWTPQADIATKNSAASLTRVVQMTTRANVEIDETEDEVMDCTQQMVTDVVVLKRKLELPVEFDCDAELLAGFAGAAMGARAGNNLEMLDTGEFQPDFYTGCMMFKNQAGDTGRLFTFTVRGFTVNQDGKQRVKVTADLVGPADLEAAGLTELPACTELVPIYSYQCALSIDGVDRMQANADLGTTTQKFGLKYSNKNLVQDDAWQAASIDMTRAERHDVVENSFDWLVEDYPGGALSVQAHANPREKVEVVWRVGPAEENVTFTATEAILRANKKEQEFVEEAPRSCLALSLQPTPVGAAMPLSGLLTT